MKQSSIYFSTKQLVNILILIITASLFTIPLHAQDSNKAVIPGLLRVGIAGTPPFVTDSAGDEGISVEIWQMLALQKGWKYESDNFEDVPHALQALQEGKVDVVVGPVSITSDRVKRNQFSQPYYQSSLSILSRSDEPSFWERLKPFFSEKFFIAVIVFILILMGVGALLWLAEREQNPDQFPPEPASGIANGMWCAIVTMSTTGYGDRSPVTFWGRIIAGSWMVVSLIFATTMVAGIASTLTLTGMSTTVISTANELNGKNVAVVTGSPADHFVKRYGAHPVAIENLQQGYDMLKNKQADAVVYDRPQLLYFLKQHHDKSVAVSVAEYDRQGYGFALPLRSNLLHSINVGLLQMKESGRVERIVSEWLGDKE